MSNIEDGELVEAAEYQGKKVTLGKPFRTQGGPKKFAVYVRNSSGKVIIVRFGDPNMEIKRDDPKRRKAFRDRHSCSEKKDRTTPGYWSCRQWSTNKVEASYDEIWEQNEGEVIEGIEEVIEASHEDDEPCCGGCAKHAEAKEIRKDVYDNPGEATGRAKELGLEGIHSHEENGSKVFMPGKTHEEYEKKTGKKLASYHDKDEKKASASQCGIGEEFIDGECRIVNVTMDLEILSASSIVCANTGNAVIQIKGIAFHEGMNKNNWSLTRSGAENLLPQMVGADLTLNHPKAKAVGFDRNMDGGVDEAVVGEVIEATIEDKEDGKYNVRYVANVERSELFEALESGLWMRPGYGVSIGGYGVPVKADEDGLVFDEDFTFDHLAIVHKPAYERANIEEITVIQTEVKDDNEIASDDETFISQPLNGFELPKEVNIMSEKEMNIEQSDVIASEMEAMKADLILAQATIEEYKAQEAAKAETSRLALVQKASEIGLKGHEDLTEDTLTSLIASWEEAKPVSEPAEMKPVEPAVASENSVSIPTESTKVVANYLNGKIVETEEGVYERAFNAWASAWNRTLSGVEASEGRFKAPLYNDIKEMI
jgi:hypothetical protein